LDYGHTNLPAQVEERILKIDLPVAKDEKTIALACDQLLCFFSS
jgi:hypothetical protein